MSRFLRSQRRHHWFASLLTIGIMGIAAWGNDRVAAPPAAGTTISGQASALKNKRGILRVATFNIHGGRGTDHRRDLSRIAEELQGLDLIAAQEVRGASFTGVPDQAALLAEKLNLSWLYAPAERRWWRDSFGNALLTRLPITHWRRTPLVCTQGKGYRNLVMAEIALDDATLHVLLTHLDRSTDRQEQLREVVRIYRELPPPAILMGDLNTDAHDPFWAKLLKEPEMVDVLGNSTPATNGDRRIDWIIARGMEVIDAGVRDKGASDHPCYWAELRLPVSRVAQPRRSTISPR